MPIELRCPSPTCRQKLRLPDSVAGRAFKCPGCKDAVIEAPALSLAAAVAPAPPVPKAPPPLPPKLTPPAPKAPPPPMPVEEELVEVIEEDDDLVDVIAEDTGELVEVIADDGDLIPVQDAGDELVEILPDDVGVVAAGMGSPPLPPAQVPQSPVLSSTPGELLPSTPGWHQASMLQPRHLSIRIRKGFTGPDYKVMDMASKEQIGAAWNKGKRTKRASVSFFDALYKGLINEGELNLYIREEKDAPVLFSLRMLGRLGSQGRMATCERVEIYNDNDDPLGSVRFDVAVIFDELKSLLVFDLNNHCIARTKKRTVKSQRTKQKVPYIALMDANDEEVGKITTEQREVVKEEERMGLLFGAFDPHGITALVRKRYDTPSTRVIMLSLLLTLKLTNAWEGGLETEGR